MKYFKYILGIALSVFLVAGMAKAVTVLYPGGGGTGTSQVPTYGKVLVGQSNGTYLPTATSSLNIAGTVTGNWTGTFDGQEGTYYLSRTNHTGTQGVSTLSNYDWTFSNNYGAVNLTGSTTAPWWAQGGLNASSTSHFGNASTSQISISNFLDYIGTTLDTGVKTGTARLQAVTSNGITRLINLSETGVQKVVNQDNVFLAKNVSGGTLTAGQVIYINGSTGAIPNVTLAKADALATASPTVGVVTASISNNGFGEIMLNGIVDNINTSAFTAGDNVFVSTTTAGALTNLRSTYPNYTKGIGIVLNSGVGNGSILVNVAPFLGGIESGTTASQYIFGGKVGIGTTSPYTSLGIGGEIVANNFTATSTATSTFPYLSVTTNSNLGTVVGGIWNGTAIGDTYLTKSGDWTGTIDSNNFAGGAIGAGELIYGGSAGSFSELALGTNGYVLALSGGVPAWVATTTLSTISGTLDISSQSNLTCGTNCTLTGDDISVDDAFILNTGDIGTGVYDFGGATSLEVPNGAPTIDTTGEIGIDTTSGQLKWSYNGSTLGIQMPYFERHFVYATSSAWSATTSKPYLAPAPANVTMTTAFCETDTGTTNVSVLDGSGNRLNMLTASTTIGTFTFSTNNTFTKGESMRVEVGTPASSPTLTACTFLGTYDAD